MTVSRRFDLSVAWQTGQGVEMGDLVSCILVRLASQRSMEKRCRFRKALAYDSQACTA